MRGEKLQSLAIRTPEGIVFSLPLAGPVTRFLALVIDLACIWLLVAVTGALAGVLKVIDRDLARALTILVYFAVTFGYGILTEWFWRGQTLGKRVLKLRVVDERGRRLQFSQVVIRNLLRAVDSLPLFYLVGGTARLLSAKAQRLGDLAGGTVVIRCPTIPPPDLSQVAPGKFNSFRHYPHLTGRLRQRVSAQEANLALRALLRRDLFEPRARLQVFAQLARHFLDTVPFPEEALEGLSDEQVVRNVADIMFRQK